MPVPRGEERRKWTGWEGAENGGSVNNRAFMRSAVAWRRLFRSAALHSMSRPDIARLKEDIRPRAVIDLRTPREPNKQREISPSGGEGIETTPSPSARERVGVRVAMCSRIIRASA
jgi:hypothetical protein